MHGGSCGFRLALWVVFESGFGLGGSAEDGRGVFSTAAFVFSPDPQGQAALRGVTLVLVGVGLQNEQET